MKLKIKDGRGELYQWDTGRKLIIEDGANIDYLHFADFSKDDGVSYQSEVIEENGIRYCRIPNACFANESTKLVVYAVDADNDGMATTTTVVFPIRKRQKPSDYTASPEIIISAEEILRKASAKADEAESYMNTSMQYAINPVDEVISGTDKYSSLHWASKANDIYNDVVKYVGSPSDPSSALGSIDTAKQSAITDIDAHVDTVKIDLTSYVENAESYSEEAASYASQALSYSTSASTSESNAKAAAEAAAAAESNSLSYKDLAETAKSNAQNARDEAVSAKNIAIETNVAIQGIESNVSSMKSSVDASEANVTTMQSDVSTMKASVETLKSETQTIVDNAENDVKGLLSTKADKTELAVERARIDSLSKLSEGSTTGDAELIDLRIGVDGVTYGNAGTAVRTQISNLKGDISELGFNELTEQKNIISAQGITLTLADNNSIWNSSGSISTNINYYRAINEPIPVESGKTYIFKNLYGDQYTHGQLMFFDSSMKNGVQVTVSSDSMEYTVPDGKYYVCLTLNRSFASNIDNVEIIGDIGTGKFKSENMVFTDNQILQVVENIPNNSIEVPMTNFAEYVDAPDWVDTTNMLDDTTWGASGYMRHTNGQLVTSEYTTNYIASDFIAVVPEYKYRAQMPSLQGCTLYAVCFSDSKNDGVSTNLGWLSGGEYVDFTVPSGKTYVSFNCVDNGTNKIEGLYRRTQLENEKGISIPRLVIASDSDKPFYGKTIVNFGDSIFGQARPPVDVSTFLANETGATVYNCGFGGCQMTKHAQSLYDPFSMYRIADAIVNNDWTLQDDSISAGGIPSYFGETIALLKTIDFSKVDIVTIGYGINDFNNGASLTAETFNGFKYAMKYSIETLLNAYPNLRIFVCTMTYGFSTDGSGDTDTFEHTSWVDSITTKYTDWVEMQKTVAMEYHLPIIDNYYDLGINKFNKLQYFSSGDGTHQALEGRKLIAKHMAKCLW